MVPSIVIPAHNEETVLRTTLETLLDKLNNKEGDYTITYRASEKNNFLTLLSYPSISGFYQQKPVANYLKDMFANNKKTFYLCIMQYVVLVIWIGAALLIDWEKAFRNVRN